MSVSTKESGEALKPKAMYYSYMTDHMRIPYSDSPDTHFETDVWLIVKCHRVVMQFYAPRDTFLFCVVIPLRGYKQIKKQMKLYRHEDLWRSELIPFVSISHVSTFIFRPPNEGKVAVESTHGFKLPNLEFHAMPSMYSPVVSSSRAKSAKKSSSLPNSFKFGEYFEEACYVIILRHNIRVLQIRPFRMTESQQLSSL